MNKENYLDLSLLDNTFYDLLFEHLMKLHKQQETTIA